ncbi:neuronal acetylcholine receptor subunit alpha-7-like [Ylistrum balloti]|uniref:neuronal acetylcholine receptor subunit alpha-7-like n=1 Tax=Ylistrum balloti TaxID=509963 RepID=UPI002905A695|nr:neuronal acetylcholine receptor subunit alpha-7-like [Ylistrum balloti]
MMEDLVRLRDTLFQNYTKDFRPAQNMSDPTYVTLEMYLVSILDLDEVSGTITLNCAVPMSWTDYRLVWNPSDYGGITSFVFNSSIFWKPRVYIITSSDDLSDFSFDAYDVRVFSNGRVTSSPGRHVKASCSVDMTNFPSDSQICVMQMMSWGLLANEMIFIAGRETIVLRFYKPNGEWDIDWTSVANNTKYGTSISVVDFTIHLTRHSAYFTVSMTMPVILLCFLNPFVFLLPASSGERMSYTITIFLSLAVYMTIIGDNMPRISDPMAGISYFLLVALLNSCILIVLTIFTLRCEAVNDTQKFPGWLLRLVSWRQCQSVNSRNQVKNKKTIVHVEEVNATNEITHHRDKAQEKTVSKEDVMKFIDKYLFYSTLLAMIVTCVVFSLYYWL